MDANGALFWGGWLFLIWGVVDIYQERSHDKWRWVYRDEEPFSYWSLVGIRFFMAVFFWGGLYYRKLKGIG